MGAALAHGKRQCRRSLGVAKNLSIWRALAAGILVCWAGCRGAAGEAPQSAGSAGTAFRRPDLAFLRDLTPQRGSGIPRPPGKNVGSSPTNTCGFALLMPGGKGGYPAFWIRDFAMSLESGFVSPQEMLDHLRLMARCQNGPQARQLQHGLVLPPFAQDPGSHQFRRLRGVLPGHLSKRGLLAYTHGLGDFRPPTP